MWVYAGLNALAFRFVWQFLPELKGRSLAEVEEALRRNRFTPVHFDARAGTLPQPAEGTAS